MEQPIKSASNGQFQKGNPGKPHGAVSHLNRTVKETVLAVFQDLQSDPKNKKYALLAFAKKYPRDFYNIAARLIPTDIKADINATVKVTKINIIMPPGE